MRNKERSTFFVDGSCIWPIFGSRGWKREVRFFIDRQRIKKMIQEINKKFGAKTFSTTRAVCRNSVLSILFKKIKNITIFHGRGSVENLAAIAADTDARCRD